MHVVLVVVGFCCRIAQRRMRVVTCQLAVTQGEDGDGTHERVHDAMHWCLCCRTRGAALVRVWLLVKNRVITS